MTSYSLATLADERDEEITGLPMYVKAITDDHGSQVLTDMGRPLDNA